MMSLRSVLVASLAMVVSVVATVPQVQNPALSTATYNDAILESDGLVQILSGCDQGNCPDHNALFDFIKVFWWDSSSEHNIAYYLYHVRVNDCDSCQGISTSNDGCVDFNSCGRDQNICVDINNNRAHRIWKDNGHKTCYSIQWEVIGSCGLAAETHIFWPLAEVACNW